MRIRKSAFNGNFYAASQKTLEVELAKLFDGIPRTIADDHIGGLIVPHAGYMYSGRTAAIGYKQLEQKQKYSNVILLGPSHKYGFDYAALDDVDQWSTPFGTIELNQEVIKEITDNKNLKINSAVFNNEHSLEVQLPFLQSMLGQFRLVPICCGQSLDHKSIAHALSQICDENCLMVTSSDLSHYHPQDVATVIDQKTLAAIKSRSTSTINSDGDACGLEVISIMNELALIKTWLPQILDYRTSANAGGDTSAVVGYCSVVYIQ